MILNLRKFIKVSMYFFINLLIFPSKKIKQKSILIIRLDAIGDYVLFRNFIEILKKNKKYKDYKISLLGNIDWKDLSIDLDSEYIEEFFWLERKRFHIDPVYRYKKLKEITTYGYEIVINPAYSREYFFSSYMIIKLISANQKIGFNVNNESVINKFYSKLINSKENIIFEFDKNRDFFEKLLEEKLPIKKPFIKLKEKKISFDLPRDYAIIFVGGSKRYKKWDIKKYARVAKHLKNNYDYKIVLCGGVNDLDDSNDFKQYFNDEYLDLVGKTNITELLQVIDNGTIMVSNDTAAPHIAVALNMKNIFVISNRNAMARFVPYPENMFANYHVIINPEKEKYLDDFDMVLLSKSKEISC